MDLIQFAATSIFFIAFSLFSYINLSVLMEKYEKVKESSFMGSGSFIKQLKYFSITEKNMGRLNSISALLFGIGGMYLKIGIFGILFGIIAGWMLPKLILGYHRKQYYKKMDNQIYPVLILIGNAMKAGETLPQAIESTKGILGYPISQEFEIVSQQIRMGMIVENALNNLADRMPIDDLKLSVKAMLISLKTGANLPVALKKIANTIRERNTLHGKINALTIQGKAQGIVVGLLPVFLGVFLFWNDPSYIKILFDTFAGNCVVAGMMVLEIMAFFVIKKIATINI